MSEREELIKLLTDCHKVLSAMYFGGNPHKDLLDRIQSALTAQQSQEPDSVLIWSGEHGMYWGENGSGYTSCECKAGRYTRKDAEYRTKHCGPEKRIEICQYTAPVSGVRAGMLRAAQEGK